MVRTGHWPRSFRKAAKIPLLKHNIDGQLRVDIDQTMTFLIGSDGDWHTLARTLPVGGATILKIAPSEPQRVGRHPRQGAPSDAQAAVRRVARLAVPTAPAGARQEILRSMRLPHHRVGSAFATCRGLAGLRSARVGNIAAQSLGNHRRWRREPHGYSVASHMKAKHPAISMPATIATQAKGWSFLICAIRSLVTRAPIAVWEL
jgi:hypothetical protein